MYNHIRKQLISHDITPNLKGFHYLLSAIAMTEQQYKLGNWYVKMCDLYAELAKKFHTTKWAVERAMRNALMTSSKIRGEVSVSEYVTSTADHNVFAYA